jgi:hypothetical protein
MNVLTEAADRKTPTMISLSLLLITMHHLDMCPIKKVKISLFQAVEAHRVARG